MQLRFKDPTRRRFVSVVIPVYRDAPGLATTLASLARQTLPATEFEVIVCNDGDDATVSEVCDRHPVKEIRISPNRGSYFARNRGLEEAIGEYIGFVDADITIPEHWVEVGRAALQRADYVGGPVIVDERQARTPADYFEVLTGFQSNHPDRGENFFVTANLFVARKVFQRVGGFDQRLRSGGDNEFGTRVFATGRFVQAFEKDLAVLHPPRGYRKLVGKKVRIAYGKEILNRLHPDRYAFTRLPTWRRILDVVIPPSPAHVRSIHAKCPQCGLVSWYFFFWRFKVERALRLLPLYRRARKQVEALERGDVVAEQARAS